MRKVVAFSGAGGVGKTSVLNALRDELENHNIAAEIGGSVTRAFYQLHGIEGEGDYMRNLLPKDRLIFQLGMCDYFLKDFYAKAIDTTKQQVLLICDRTSLDHLAYCISSCYETSDFNLDIYRQYCAKVKEYFRRVHLYVYFPYPMSWTKEVDPDTFRFAPPAKNLAIAGLITSHWHLISPPTRIIAVRDVGVDKRVEHIMQIMQYQEIINGR